MTVAWIAAEMWNQLISPRFADFVGQPRKMAGARVHGRYTA